MRRSRFSRTLSAVAMSLTEAKERVALTLWATLRCAVGEHGLTVWPIARFGPVLQHVPCPALPLVALVLVPFGGHDRPVNEELVQPDRFALRPAWCHRSVSCLMPELVPESIPE